ncbi:PREDICTED: xyloglucan endotransglucosylase/hydrolase protein 3-like [Erythranthe guttata]|nr:PREDICTED: xyloglucan endotransglucosylase/hydrolase protein 3-like [Erythranthe guttata]|eukprot:XP_012842648.1 PREDICTED: xyloglucan endotransglucosylase/hydrolase protein 3-like [Erythranthe guttata]
MSRLGFLAILLGAFFVVTNRANKTFYDYYSYLWGTDHFIINPEGTEVQLKCDKSSGAGFRSKSQYAFGVFRIKMKIPNKKTGGIVTSFYLTSQGDNEDPNANHFELDFEFFGTTNATIQTNVFMNDSGHREQAFKLWFNPAWDFHTYEIRWNPYLILFSIDNIPIRVYYYTVLQPYPIVPMYVQASIWDPPPEWTWPGPVNWENAPFIAHYSDFGFDACPTPTANIKECYSDRYYWNNLSYIQLSDHEKEVMKTYQQKYMTYDYCDNPSTRKLECVYENK